MPALKRSAREVADACFLQAVKGKAAFYGIKMEDLAEYVGVSHATWYRRLQNPGDMTLKEFRRLCKRLHWDEETVLSIVRF